MTATSKDTPTERVVCPTCGLSDQVEKVSSIYMDGLGAGRLKRTEEEDVSAEQTPERLTHFSKEELYYLKQRLSPPSAGKQPLRVLHPDLVVLFFSLLIPIIVYNLYNSQRNYFIPTLVLLGAAYLGYFIFRPRLLARFRKEQASEKERARQVERAIWSWMHLYYCARDDGVFRPGADAVVTPEEMDGYLLRE